MFALSDKKAVVTGASGGIGGAISAALHAQGATLTLAGRNKEALDQLAGELGDRTHVITGDLGDADSADAMLAAATEAMGEIDILVNNAGQSAAKRFLKITDEEWQTDLDLKLMAAVRLTRLVWPAMAEQQWGRVINLLNVYAKLPDAGTAPTSISRAAGMALTKVLSAEGAANNILVNAMLIGFIESDQIRRQHAASDSDLSLEQFITKAGARLPMQRMGRAEEAADLALFLASERASYLTGCAINMDGGLSRAV